MGRIMEAIEGSWFVVRSTAEVLMVFAVREKHGGFVCADHGADFFDLFGLRLSGTSSRMGISLIA